VKKSIMLSGMILLLAFFVGDNAWPESYAEFLQTLRKTETPRLVPKGGLKPKRLNVKDIVIETTKPGGQINTSEALLFEYGLPVLRPIPENDQNLAAMAEGIRIGYEKFPNFTYYVDGHTCDIGTDANNCRLSWDRARAVHMKLIEKGVRPEKIILRGFGRQDPAVPNTSEDTRRMNRRVVVLTGGGGQANLKDTLVCRESPYSYTGSAGYSGGSSYPGQSSSESDSSEPDMIDSATVDQLRRAAEENRRQADMASGRGDPELARDLRAAADQLDESAGRRTFVKGKSAQQPGKLPGFKPVGGKEPAKSSGDLPGFKPTSK
jgi:outer membrane protein OmpA-like peptidoglycan-associated protein